MKISKKMFCVVSLLLLSTALLLGDFELTHWKYFKPIQTGGAPAKRLVAIRIDNEVIAQSESLDRELRVIEDPTAEIPFSLATDSDEATDNERSKVRVFNKGVREGKYQQFVCDLDAIAHTTNRLQIETSSHDFTRRADVEGSNDQNHWLSLAKWLHVFDWSEGKKLKLEFPDSTHRYLRVVLWLDGGKPLDITSVEAVRHERRSGELEEVPVKQRSRLLLTPEKWSEWVFDFQHKHPLVNRCVFKVGNSNFRRRMELATSDDAKQWSAGPRLEIFRTTSGTFKDEFTTLETNALNHRYLRVRIFNGDDRPLDLTGIVFHRFVRRALFEFEPGRSYRLFYANAEAQAPSYDLTAFQNPLRGKVLTPARLGPQQDNPDFVPAQERKAWSERHPQVLWVVLIVVVIGLGLLVFRGVKSMGKSA